MKSLARKVNSIITKQKRVLIKRLNRFLPHQIILGKSFRISRNSLRKSEFHNREKLEELQFTKLKNLLIHAYKNVPYYQRIFRERNLTPDSFQNLQDIKKLPVLTKEIVKDNFDDLQALNLQKKDIQTRMTGGTKTEPLIIFINREAQDMVWAIFWRHFNWAGYYFGDRTFSMTYPFGVNGLNNLFYFDPGRRQLFCDTRSFSSIFLQKVIEKINTFKPKVIYSYPSHLYFLAKYIEKNKVSFHRPKTIVTSSELFFKEEREKIELIFGCKAYGIYANNERVISSGQCEEGNYHIDAEHTYVEVLRNNRDAHIDEIGEVIGTSLDNYAMPFIRYKVGDLCKLSNENCPCRRAHPVISDILGREEDIIKTKDKWILPRDLFFINELDNVFEAQVVRKNSGRSITIRIAREDPSRELNIANIINEVKKRISINLDIQIELAGEIQRTASGKFPFIVSENNRVT